MKFWFHEFFTTGYFKFFVAYQRHELTLLRMEDLLNHGSQGSSEATSAPLQNLGVSGRVQTAAELCHRMVDFCQRLTTAKRKILEDPDLYPEVRYSTSRHKLWVLVSLTWYFYKRNSNFLYYFSPVLSIPTLHHNFCTDQSFKLHTDKTKYISHLCKESVCAVCTRLVIFYT